VTYKKRCMKNLILILACCILVFASCGTSKKLENANSQIASLQGQVSNLTGQVDALNKQTTQQKEVIGDLKKENIQYAQKAEQCRKVEEALRQKKAKLDQALAARGTSLEQIEAKAEAAVRKLQEAGCEVTYKNGRFHISVPDTYSYQSGSATVGPQGREALNVVA
jgi:chemotaxis protein MotB